MKSSIFTFSLFLLLAACNQRPAQQSVDNHSSAERDSGATMTESANGVDRSQWKPLDFLNLDPQNPFIAADSILGLGIVTLSDTAEMNNEKLSVYDSEGKVVVTMERKEGDVITKYKGEVESRLDSLKLFAPRLYIENPDYFRLAFHCIDTGGEYYTVIIHERHGATAKIKKQDAMFRFETIEAFVDNWANVGIDFDRSTNPVRKAPTLASACVFHKDQSKYKIWQAGKEAMKGDWMKIKIEDTDETGWIRWREGNKILIRLYYLC